ncbi:MAG: phage protein Gp27 family protein [Phycisphaerae bacterium]
MSQPLRKRFLAFDLIAISAGLRCGLKVPTCEQISALREPQRDVWLAKVAEDPKAAALRDELCADFERRLRDPAYTVDSLTEWFTDQYGPIGRTSIYRAMDAYLSYDAKLIEQAQAAKQFAEVFAASGGDKLGEAARMQAQQLYFDFLRTLSRADLADAKGDSARIVRIIDSLARLQQAGAQTELLQQKVAQMRRAFEAEMQAVARKTAGGGRITDEMIHEAGQKIFGKGAP